MRAPVRSGALYLRGVYKNRVCFAIRPVKMHVAVCTGSWETAHLHSHQEHTNSPPARLFTTRRPGLALNPTPQHLKPRGFPLNRPPCPPTPLTRIFKACYLSIVHFRSFFRSLALQWISRAADRIQADGYTISSLFRNCFAAHFTKVMEMYNELHLQRNYWPRAPPGDAAGHRSEQDADY